MAPTHLVMMYLFRKSLKRTSIRMKLLQVLVLMAMTIAPTVTVWRISVMLLLILMMKKKTSCLRKKDGFVKQQTSTLILILFEENCFYC
ncbi:uncharacterized protein BX663DRAFT_506862, partial [Cokeromyces recurvatus]|uniref:uncharacterized protein n=1 Tax=Cokeromyces recurvatus TaxID=90255 RepID=UPI00221FC555